MNQDCRKVSVLFGSNMDTSGRRPLNCSSVTELPHDYLNEITVNGLVFKTESPKHANDHVDAYGIFDYDCMRELESRMCRIVDASHSDKVQREALKTVVKTELWDMYHDRKRLFEYEYKRLTRPQLKAE